jgi:hypothetical protein
MLVGAVLIWMLALPIARLVTRGAPVELSFGSVSLMDCYSVAFLAVGLAYICKNLPQVLNWTHFLIQAKATHSEDAWKEGVQGYPISQAFIPFIIGIVLFVKGRAWAGALASRQERTTILPASATQTNPNT